MTKRYTVHVMITGRVQHVWYRGWTVEQANLAGLDGWVRNRLGGKVEATFCGSKNQIETMLAMCWDGPRAAVVDQVTVLKEHEGDPHLLAGQGFQKWGTV
jgi:acylphosphatase